MLSDEEDAGGVRRAASDEEEDFVEEEEEEEESWLTKVRKKRLIYEKIDHNKMKYGEFKKNFYIESPELAKMTPEEVHKSAETTPTPIRWNEHFAHRFSMLRTYTGEAFLFLDPFLSR